MIDTILEFHFVYSKNIFCKVKFNKNKTDNSKINVYTSYPMS